MDNEGRMSNIATTKGQSRYDAPALSVSLSAKAPNAHTSTNAPPPPPPIMPNRHHAEYAQTIGVISTIAYVAGQCRSSMPNSSPTSSAPSPETISERQLVSTQVCILTPMDGVRLERLHIQLECDLELEP